MKNHLLHQNVDRSAERAPEQHAFCCGHQFITFAKLARETAKLAACLQRLGVRKGDRVGIRLSPSLESAVAVYGIMKAGAVFVPIDPLTPVDRVRDIISVGGMRHLVTSNLSAEDQSKLVENSCLQFAIGLEESAIAELITISWSHVRAEESVPLPVDIAADDPAYIIFTSGSTGTPKGIVHTHFSGQSYARLSAATYNVGSTDRIANVSPLHFDMSTFGYLTAPLAGATTILVSDSYLKLPASLSQLLEKEAVTLWYSVPFLLIQLLERGVLDKRNLSGLRWVMFGGEPFPPKHLRQLMRQLPRAEFSNVYGPAEVNQCTYFHVPRSVEAHADDGESPIPVGKLWGETEGLLLDRNGQPAMDGDEGELLIHSTTMMQKYWNGQPDDEQVFHVSDEGIRFYRTGDTVRREANGDLVFLGRKDRQVKIRGYRIELDEIEHTLATHPDVAEAAAFMSIGSTGDATITAIARVTSSGVTKEALQTFLAGRLPAYSLPSSVQIRQSFPRTTSGKIDRRQLQPGSEIRIAETFK